MRTIWKFPFAVEDSFSIEMPQGARILSVQMQGNSPCIWAIVDPDGITGKRHFRLFGTGHQFDLWDFEHIGTFQMNDGTLVFHLFEVHP